jgi:riboflavin synthase
MFTGIIQAVGTVADMQPRGGDMRLRIDTGKLSLDDVALGDSICTNGVCLTVIELSGDGYWADVSVETLNFTTLGDLKTGSVVNLEKALTPQSRLGGHIVSGHVDGASLTVNAVKGAEFDLNIIPQTMAETVFGHYRVGSSVNLEVDVIARYLERLIQGDAAANVSGEGLSMETLAENGFLGSLNTSMWKQ